MECNLSSIDGRPSQYQVQYVIGYDNNLLLRLNDTITTSNRVIFERDKMIKALQEHLRCVKGLILEKDHFIEELQQELNFSQKGSKETLKGCADENGLDYLAEVSNLVQQQQKDRATEADRQKQIISALTAQLSSARRDILAKNSIISRLETTIAEVERRSGEEFHRALGLQKKLDERVAKLEQGKADLDKQQSDVRRLTDEYYEGMAKLDEREAKLEQGKADLDKRQSDFRRLTDEYYEAMAKLDEREAKLEQGKADLDKQQSDFRRLTDEHYEGMAKLDEREAKLEQGRADLDKQQSDFRRLTDEHYEGMAKLDEREAKLEQGRADLDKQKSDFRRLTDEYYEAMAKLDEREAKIEQGKANLDKQQSEFRRLKDEYYEGMAKVLRSGDELMQNIRRDIGSTQQSPKKKMRKIEHAKAKEISIMKASLPKTVMTKRKRKYDSDSNSSKYSDVDELRKQSKNLVNKVQPTPPPIGYCGESILMKCPGGKGSYTESQIIKTDKSQKYRVKRRDNNQTMLVPLQTIIRNGEVINPDLIGLTELENSLEVEIQDADGSSFSAVYMGAEGFICTGYHGELCTLRMNCIQRSKSQ